MAQTLKVGTSLTCSWDYQEVVTIGNPRFASQIQSAKNYVHSVSTGLKSDLVYAQRVSITSSTTSIDLNSFADRLGNTQNFARIKGITAICTSGAGQLRMNYNASGLAIAVSATVDTLAGHRFPMEADTVLHFEKATTTGYPVAAGDTIILAWVSGTFTVDLFIHGSAT